MTEQPIEARKAYYLQQADVAYDANGGASLPRSQACSTCRWFKTCVPDDMPSNGAYGCQIVESYPLPIVPNGWCDQWTAIPEMKPEPLEVVIVEVEIDTSVGQMSLSENKTSPPAPGILDQIKSFFGVGSGNSANSPQIASFKVHGNHFLATYSGNFEDKEGEYFPQKAIEEYIARVETGIVDYPTLAVWHYVNPKTGKGAVVGKAKAIGLVGNLIVAAGEFYPDARSQKAKAYYSKNAKKTRMSHGFFYDAKHFRDNAYWRFNTFELTLLPAGKEAFPFTAFDVKELKDDMVLGADARKYLEDIWGKEETDKIVAERENASKAIQELGVRYKDFSPIETKDASKPTVDPEGYKQLIVDLSEGQGDIIDLIKSLGAKVETQDKAIATLTADNTKMQAALALKPTPASQSQNTEVDASDPGKKQAEDELKKKVGVTYDPAFPGMKVPMGE